jgi:GNAT superfamily N-acetyltransferase
MTASRIQSSPEKRKGERVSVTITYLEQTERPVLATPARPAGKTAIMRVDRPPIHFYRYLYRLVGDPWKWVSRRRLNDEELSEIIHDPSVYVYVLYVDGAPAGFAEIDAREREYAELKFFGLAPDFTGRRFGGYFLTNVIDLAWSLSPKALRLETCTLDHPAALSLYQKAGFRVYDRKDGVVELID